MNVKHDVEHGLNDSRRIFNVVNAPLFETLVRLFGQVKIHNEGERPEFKEYDGYKVELLHWGECYSVCCPFCGDTRFRLWLSCAFDTKVGKKKVYPAICYNERCLDELANRKKLLKHIRKVNNGATNCSLFLKTNDKNHSHTFEEETRELALPSSWVSVRDYPSKFVTEYFTERNFDLDCVLSYFEIYISLDPTDSILQNRIIFPIIFKNKFVAWTARATGNETPKYFSSPKTKIKNYLYNYDNASRFKTVTLVEGIFDVFRLRCTLGLENVVALFGNSISRRQIDLINTTWKKVILMLDGDAIESAAKIKKYLNNCIDYTGRVEGDPDSFFSVLN